MKPFDVDFRASGDNGAAPAYVPICGDGRGRVQLAFTGG
jgi:hypothetical protein